MPHAIWDILWRRRPVSRATYAATAVATSLAVSMAVAVTYWLVVVRPLEDALPEYQAPNLWEVLFGWVIFAPLAETLLVAVTAAIARAITDREGIHVLAVGVPFALLHALNGATAADAGGHALATIPGFLVFTLVYVVWRRESFRDAYWMSVLVHALHNGVLGLLSLADMAVRSFGPGPVP